MISNNIGWFSLFKKITDSGSYKSFEELVQFLNEQFLIFKNFILTPIFKLSFKKKTKLILTLIEIWSQELSKMKPMF
jgi:hypothetical protein